MMIQLICRPHTYKAHTHTHLGLDDRHDVLRQRRREEQRLARARQVPENRVQRRQETHVEQAVGLVEHENAQGLEAVVQLDLAVLCKITEVNSRA